MELAIIEFVFALIAHAIAGIYSSTLKYTKKTTYIIWSIWVVLQSILLYYTEFVMTNMAWKFFSGFILSIIGQYVIFFVTTKGRLGQRIFTILTYSIFYCIFMALFTMMKGTFSNMPIMQFPIISAVILFGILYYFLHYVCPLCRAAAPNITTGWALLIFVNIFFLITIIFSSIFPVRLTNFSDPFAVTFIFLSLSVFVVYPLIFSNINSLSEAATKREIESQNKLLLAQIEIGNAKLAVDSQMRHDRRHHNLVMLEFANNNDIESVREYLKNLVESESEIWGGVRYCDNMTINTVLAVYERRAREQNISVNISANADSNLVVLPQDLVIIIANLFENAINAITNLRSDEKWIDIVIKESAQRLLIKIENSCRKKLSFDECLYGIGIRSIISTTEKYDGMYDFSAENGIFSAKISLNLK